MKLEQTIEEFDQSLDRLAETHRIFAPKCYPHEGRFSDTDLIRYGEVSSLSEMVFDQKSDFSPKEIFFPQTETLFFFTEEQYKTPKIDEKPILVFVRACDWHSVKRFDDIYLNNKFSDGFYERRRKLVHFAVVGCDGGFDTCFCVSMGCNAVENYEIALNITEAGVQVDVKDAAFDSAFCGKESTFDIEFVKQNDIAFTLPENIELKEVVDLEMWREYDRRCIACGRCNFVCPTCTCTTMQDIFYSETQEVGERRRVWASCHVDGFSEMAGGHDFRTKHGDRMRFKTMHKVADFNRRFGYHMCTGCGRCDDTCPEYISFSNCVQKLIKEVGGAE